MHMLEEKAQFIENQQKKVVCLDVDKARKACFGKRHNQETMLPFGMYRAETKNRVN